MKITPVILSGGSGTRLWPVSRRHYPKQLLPLVNDTTLLQDAINRVANHDLFSSVLLIANEEHRFIVAEQVRDLEAEVSEIILEPIGRNTAPAVALAALSLLSQKDDALMLVMPSDHVVKDVASFQQAVKDAQPAALDGFMVTFGIVPTGPETGYGYIKKGVESIGTESCFNLIDFVEKPDMETAQSYIDQGGYYWNAGIFLMSARQYIKELDIHAPDILEACKKAYEGSVRDLDFLRLDVENFIACRSESIDYAVMENTSRAAVVPVDMGWNDIGSWSALWGISEVDDDGNALQGEVVSINNKNCLIRSEGVDISAIGIHDLIIVSTKDAVLVANKSNAQDVKKVVDKLRERGSEKPDFHTIVHRPWGTYETTDSGDRFQVKRIVVKPGARLSLQKHHHRAEHWIVVKGTACVTCDDKEFLLTENQSTYVPLGAVHRLENPGKVPLHLIEVQSGSYLSEDDIVRIEDVYGRD